MSRAIHGEMEHSNVTAKVIFDNAGVTVQLRSGDALWAHYYDAADRTAAAGDVFEALYRGTFYDFDGHEDAAACAPTDDAVRNGGCRVHEFSSTDAFEAFCFDNDDWANVRDFKDRGQMFFG